MLKEIILFETDPGYSKVSLTACPIKEILLAGDGGTVLVKTHGV